MSFRNLNDIIIDESDVTTSDIRSESLDFTYLDGLSVQVLTTGTIAGTLKIEASNNNQNWVELASPTITITNATSSIINLDAIHHRYIRLFHDATSGTTNTLKVWVSAKGK